MADLIDELTLAEKASLCLGSDVWHTTPVPRLGLPAVMLTDGPHGLRRKADEGDQVSITGSMPATCFPTASALGSSWDPDLVRRVGAAIGAEARAQGVGVVLGPGINIKRSPLCGRNFEYFSEDPFLSGILGAAHVEGVQSQGVGACVKHFAANNQETDRVRVSPDVDERTLREIYLPGFERVVTEARPWLVMCAYNRINGVHASQHRWLLTEVLREEWGFDGLVVSDWGAVHDRVAALVAGLDLEMPPKLGVSDAAIVAAVRTGELDEAVLDRAVERVLHLIDRASTSDTRTFDAAAHHALARRVAADCAVLLKNDGILPLRPAADTTIAVIGPFARTPRFQGAGSSQVNPTAVDVPLDELRALLPAGAEAVYAVGFGDSTDEEEAVTLAARADVVIAFLGLPDSAETEGVDRRHMDLPDGQTAVLARLAAANPNLVVVLANGSAVRVSTWEHHARAILECWLSGQAAGGAIADLLLGHANPSGRLAETLPVRLEDSPSYLNFPGEDGHVRYGEGLFVGYRGYDATGREVSYPFGHGLSYTRFRYDNLAVTVEGSDGAPSVMVSCDVTNVGERAGSEVAQLYVGAPGVDARRPVRELKGFAKVLLAPGETRTAIFRLNSRDLSYWSARHRRWVLEAGRYALAVGASSRDLRLSTTVDISAEPMPVSLDAHATLREWLADPDGAALLRAAVDADGHAPRAATDDEVLQVLGDFPLDSLAWFPGLGIDEEVLRLRTGG